MKILNIWTDAKTNIADPDQTAPKEQSDQGLHRLPFYLYLWDTSVHCKTSMLALRLCVNVGVVGWVGGGGVRLQI